MFVVELADGARLTDDVRDRLLAVAASDPRTKAVRTVLPHRALPVDPRHNSKIDREALGHWAAEQLGTS